MKKLIVLTSFLLTLGVSAQKLSKKFYQNSSKVLTEFVQSPALRHAHKAVSIRSLETGKEIVGFNSADYFAPASNLKLLYTLAVVDKFGKDYRYKTKLFKEGKTVNHTLFGDLIFQASGDPSFGSIRMKEDYKQLIINIVSSIKSHGIQRVTGNLAMELNGWRYPAPGSIPIEDIGNYYGTGAWDFNFNDNRIDIYLQRSLKEGAPTKVLYTHPKLEGISYISKVKTAAPDTDDEAYIYAVPYENTRYILGTIPAGKEDFKVKGGMPNPPLSFLKLLQQKLKQEGISVKGIKIINGQFPHTLPIWEYQSQPLLDLAKITNDYSMNHFSEAFAWLLVNGDQPAYGYLDKKKIKEFFTQYGLEEADIEDGCGLAPDDLVEPRQMTAFLKLMKDKLGLETELDILPHGGVDGYAKYFLRDSKVQKNVWVKSGSISKVRNYTGIFKSRSGKYYSFSVMTNFFSTKHKEVRKAIETLVEQYIKIL